MAERVLTSHPEPGKAGVNICKHKYDLIRGAILEAIRARGDIQFKELADAVRRRLSGGFEGSISWYVTTVKLDLEARGLIERIPKSRPQRLRLAEQERSGR